MGGRDVVMALGGVKVGGDQKGELCRLVCNNVVK